MSSDSNRFQIKEIDVSGCKKIGGGFNGSIYRLDDEMVVKVFERSPDIDDILHERFSSKQALIAGVPTAISFGFAHVGDKPAILYELINGTTLSELFAQDHENISLLIHNYTDAVHCFHRVPASKLGHFPERNAFLLLLEKLTLVSELLTSDELIRLKEMLDEMPKEQHLLHGDIQPGNLMMSNGELLFIDMDTVCQGPAEIDLIYLERTLVSLGLVKHETDFLGIPFNDRIYLNNAFQDSYCKDMPPEESLRIKRNCNVLGMMLSLAFVKKKGYDAETVNYALKLLREKLD